MVAEKDMVSPVNAKLKVLELPYKSAPFSDVTEAGCSEAAALSAGVLGNLSKAEVPFDAYVESTFSDQ